ncbi:rhamnose utilization protein RhaD (predicted bifunctional aldolase and dehydrogenase) [Microbacterium ginsengiterrae]|uniref:Rhamnose utilization protein RhaD (Predicted bifunctional aldolase and dehydrogenase) n=1 Tax=Microbacterium ginsengiterrae TaxID=546115 RepID=A0A7W9CCR0_9MICO|nr:class II aldolase/adducin family protein [Microbacterium ginsengiterrae]MBB5743199.1 rhamnose utilization protein RhaD (predicted bifunctional aldolase and dehydrogenase) [Microbacterium ginsengiterrae]
MNARVSPNLVSAELIELTRRLGLPERDLVILAEGNTSEQIDDRTLVVKASGSSMADATADTFVAVDQEELLRILRDPGMSQDDLTTALTAATGIRASIESLVHVAVRAFGPKRYVAHTHPTDVVALLASAEAETSFALPVYSEEYMILGRPLFVPYAQPGMELGRVFLDLLGEYVTEHGELPSLVLLGNHGIVAISDTAAGVEAISLMAVKSARVRLGARAAGGVAPLDAATIASYFDRPDFRERRAGLAGTQ